MGIVAFDYALWSRRYPELAGFVDQPTAEGYFDEATLYLDNTDGSIVQDVARRAVLLDMIVAHLAKLYSPIGGKQPSGLVGRISNATEGSVSVATDAGQQSASAAFWLQTKYGFSYWQATAIYRTFRYRAPCRPNPGIR